MDIYLTADYEIYFGKPHGSVDMCIIKPTNLLLDICEKHEVKTTQFIDVGYLIKLKDEENNFPHLKEERLKVESQIKILVEQGHSCQLHIHPHWETAKYDGKNWHIDLKTYKLSDFKVEEAKTIVIKYHRYLTELTQSPVTAYRAGGWCIQPFEPLNSVFKELGIRTDSSVFSGGKNNSHPYYYDFTTVPPKSKWNFENDPTQENEAGFFTEIPITGATYSPLFFWKLYSLGRIRPSIHKPLGDGYPISSGKNTKWSYLTRNQNLFASMDGYFAASLSKISKNQIKNNRNEMVVIGHPKAYTYFSLNQLDKFISDHKKHHNFKTLGSV